MYGVFMEMNVYFYIIDKVVIVYNGIIENFWEFCDELSELGCMFSIEIDLEIIVYLVLQNLEIGLLFVDVFVVVIKWLEGVFVIGILFKDEEDLMIVVWQGLLFVVGMGDGEMFIGLDVFVLVFMINCIIYLEDGDWVEIIWEMVVIWDVCGNVVKCEECIVLIVVVLVDKGDYKYFMVKEIFEQLEVIGYILGVYINLFK